MNELALFAGAGGGILGGKLLGWRTICAVERDAYAAQVLAQRQNDGILEPFPIWSDITSFDGKPWRGIVDVVSGGFPCQDISVAGKGIGITGSRSGLWKEMARIIGEIRPKFAFVENSPMLTSRGLGTVLADLASMGFDAEWGVLSAADVGAPHLRKRIWILGYSYDNGQAAPEIIKSIGERSNNNKVWKNKTSELERSGKQYEELAHSSSIRQSRQGMFINFSYKEKNGERETSNVIYDGERGKWPIEPNVGRVANGVDFRMDRLKAIGNGQVPRVAATAFTILKGRLENV